jgi:aryl-alcohol dehydrogenase-like predicted oxidoreductase
LAIAWCARNPRVSSVITGASSLGQLQSNLQALQVLDKLDAGTLMQIDAITSNLAG